MIPATPPLVMLSLGLQGFALLTDVKKATGRADSVIFLSLFLPS